MEVKKVWMITPLFIPVKGGTEVHVYNLSKELVKMSLKVEVHTTRDTYESRGVLPSREVMDGIDVVRHARTWFYGDSPSVLHFHNLGRKLSTWNLYTILFMFLSPLVSSPKVMTPHHIFVVDRGKVMNSLQMRIGKAVDRIIAVSEWEKEEMINVGYSASKIVVIPNGVEDMAFDLPKANGSHDYLLFIGRISPEKNQLFAVECMKEVNAKLFLAGEIRDRAYFEMVMRRVNELGLQDRVKYLGVVNDQQKYSLMDGSLAVILTSKVEAEGIVVKEAMVRRVPVIVGTEAKVLPRLVQDGETGFVVERCDQLKDVVKKLMDERTRLEIGENQARVSRDWRWNSVAKKVLEVYSNL